MTTWTSRVAALIVALLVAAGLASPAAASPRLTQGNTAQMAQTAHGPTARMPQTAPAKFWDNVCKWGMVTPAVNATCTVKKVVKDGPTKAVKDTVTEAADTALGPFSKSFRDWTADFIKKGMTYWLMSPSLTVQGSGILEDKETKKSEEKKGKVPHAELSLQGIMLGIGIMVAIILTMMQGIRTMIQRKGTPIAQVIQGLIINALVVAVGVGVIDSLLLASDKLTNTILAVGFGEDDAPKKMVGLMLPSIANPAGQLFMVLVVFLVGLVQLVLLFLRQAAVPIQALLLPIAGAGQVGGESSRKWLPRLVTAIFAVICYKPVAALIFTTGFVEVDNSSTTVDWLRGVVTLVLATFALKGLLAIFAPIGEAVGTASAGSGGGLAGGLMQLAGAMGGGPGPNPSGPPPPSPPGGAGAPGGSALGQAEAMNKNGPGAQNGKSPGDSSEGSSAVQQANSGKVPAQQGAGTGGQAAADGAGTAAGPGTGPSTGGGGGSTAAKGGAVTVGLVAAEAVKKSADKGGNTMGKGE